MQWSLCVATVLVTLLQICDPQFPQIMEQPRVLDSLRLANILMERPIEGPSIRKECRMLNSTEYQKIVNAINAAKLDTRVRPNVHDAYSFLHAHPEVNKGAHAGPAFLPYHRVLIFLYEKLLRIYDRDVSLCYWDTTVEPENMEWSAIWTPELYGNVQGTVTTGFARGWVTPIAVLNRAGEFVETAAYDPIFWFHHSYVDCLYERFRQRQKERGVEPMRDWPVEHGDSAHAPFAPMRIGSLRNIDGAQDFFSREIVRCEPLPVCTSDRECGDYMRCDRARQKCISDTLRPPAQVGGMWDSVENLVGSLWRSRLSALNDPLAESSFGFGNVFQQPELFQFSGLRNPRTRRMM
ncbi:tyrosinase-like protein 2 [Aplysia californica]|uniref:Tyrosinase-like protein 2 n=1 Tax=Aplysia californica TaxID=6500 RepID=A0ABM1ABF7_APLCA|nr:tyrosinase-like protein 2 [Aplysia californica]